MKKINLICINGVGGQRFNISPSEVLTIFPKAQKRATMGQLQDEKRRGVYFCEYGGCIIKINGECPNFGDETKKCICDTIINKRERL